MRSRTSITFVNQTYKSPRNNAEGHLFKYSKEVSLAWSSPASILIKSSRLWFSLVTVNIIHWINNCILQEPCDILTYPMLRADSRFWLVNNREIWSRISRLTSPAWDIKTKERHWWRHNGDSDRRPLSLLLRYDLVTLCLYDDLGQINVIAGILKLRKRFRMSQILFEHGINSLPLVCWRGYGNYSTLSIAIPRFAFGRAWYCDAACG